VSLVDGRWRGCHTTHNDCVSDRECPEAQCFFDQCTVFKCICGGCVLGHYEERFKRLMPAK
ncbi:hypothetical protein AAVH_31933, partial [Aphelenchoides avenae]